jgi:hypothetical protein
MMHGLFSTKHACEPQIISETHTMPNRRLHPISSARIELDFLFSQAFIHILSNTLINPIQAMLSGPSGQLLYPDPFQV